MEKKTIIADTEGQRLDRYLAEKLQMTRASVQKLIKDGLVTIDGQKTKPGHTIRQGQAIEITIPEPEPQVLVPEPIGIDILYMDDFLVVVNKPPGLVVYPAAGHRRGTLMNAIAYHAKKLATVGGPLRPGVMHRLDKDTSGVMVVALDDRAYYGLVEQFSQRTVKRHYITIVHGSLRQETGEIDLPIGRSRTHRKKFSTKTSSPKEARTLWQVLERFKDATMLKVVLKTGRTHQIRVHFSAMGHPVLGDCIYGRKTYIKFGKQKIRVPRQMLHAQSLGFVHPITGKKIHFETPLPEDMTDIIRLLRGIS
ncbi:MAG: RluA family pseudouridine synthase [Nitrospirae bacterium]|nr:MAG: RluA family pseudouridine synthase [Nitrospirota bacterium]